MRPASNPAAAIRLATLTAVLWTGCSGDDELFGSPPAHLDGDGGRTTTGAGAPVGGSQTGSGASTSSSPAGGSNAGGGGAAAGSTGGIGGAGTGGSAGSGAGGSPPVDCDPLHPYAGCGPGMHCLPTPSGEPLCSGPTGSGQQNSWCASSDSCAAPLECVSAESQSCCMAWCVDQADCAAGAFCTSIDPTGYIGQQEYGVCWDPMFCGWF